MWPNLQFPADLVTFTKEIINAKLRFLYTAYCVKSFQKRYFFLVPIALIWLDTEIIRGFSWSLFSFIWTEYWDLLRIPFKSPHPFQIRENTDQKKLSIWILFTFFEVFYVETNYAMLTVSNNGLCETYYLFVEILTPMQIKRHKTFKILWQSLILHWKLALLRLVLTDRSYVLKMSSVSNVFRVKINIVGRFHMAPLSCVYCKLEFTHFIDLVHLFLTLKPAYTKKKQNYIS